MLSYGRPVPDGVVASFDAMVEAVPGSIAVVGADRALSWEAFGERARRVAWHLATEARLEAGNRVAISLGGDPELLEVLYASLMLGCAPVIMSASLDADAIHAVVDRSDAKVLVHRPERAKVARAAVKPIAKPWRPLLVGIGDRYERAIESAPPAREWRPSPTGTAGTLLVAVGAGEPGSMLAWNDAELVVALRASLDPNLRGARVLPLAPLSHTLGLFAAMRTLLAGGTVVLTDVEPLDAPVVWGLVSRDEVEVVSIASVATLHALTEAMSRDPERWPIPRLRAVVSSVRIGPVARRTMADLFPGVELREPSNAPRRVGDLVRVIELGSGRDVAAGSGAVGTVVVGGAVPLGYHGDPQRTASSFCVINGVRYAITGEQATVDLAGTICTVESGMIDAEGEPAVERELELKLRKHPSVAACVIVQVAAGHPDRRAHGQLVALVQVRDGHYLDEPELAAWWRARQGRYEAPARFLLVDQLEPEECDPHDRDRARRRAAMLLDL